jgi:hypothetical protein
MTSTALRESRLLQVTEIVRRRLLPGSGDVLVSVGDRVQPDDIVAQASVDGQLGVIDLARELGTGVRQALRFLRVSPGQEIEPEELIASRKGFWRQRQEIRAPFAGVVQTVEDGYVFLRQHSQRFDLSAYIPGQVIEQYPHRGVAIGVNGSVVRGIWGSGGEHQGMLATMVAGPDQVLTWERVGLRYRGTILVGGILEDARVLLRARQFRIVGIVTGGILPGLRPLCERLRFPVLVTKGMGRIPMAEPVFELLRSYHGRSAVMAGSPQLSASGPELVIPLPGPSSDAQALMVVRPIERGMRVRLTRAPYLGVVAEVVGLPTMPQQTSIGSFAEGALVRLPEGRRIFVPLVNLEPLG